MKSQSKILPAVSVFLLILLILVVNTNAQPKNETGTGPEEPAQTGTNIAWSVIAVVILLALLPVLRGLILAKRKRQKSLIGIKEEIKRLAEGLKAAGVKEGEILGSVKKFAPKAKDLREFLGIVEKKNDEGWLTVVRNKLSSLFSSRKIAIKRATFVMKATTKINPLHARNAAALYEKVLAQQTMANMLEKEEGKNVEDIKKVIKDADRAIKDGDLKRAGYLINSAAEMLQKLKKK